MAKSTSMERRKQKKVKASSRQDCTVNINVSLLARVYGGKLSPRPCCNLCRQLIEMKGSRGESLERRRNKNTESQKITALGVAALPVLPGAPRPADLRRCRPGTLPPFHSGTLCSRSQEDIG